MTWLCPYCGNEGHLRPACPDVRAAREAARMAPAPQPAEGSIDGGMSHKEIAEVLGISRQAVAQIERRALRKLGLRARHLAEGA